MLIDTQGIENKFVLMALFNATKIPQAMGLMHYVSGDMKESEAVALLENQEYFDYLQGRVMKVKIKGDHFDGWLYDRDNGDGAAQRAVDLARTMSQGN